MGDSKKSLTVFFEDYMKKESIFVNKKVLQESYTPETIPHREEHIEELANILAPMLRMEKPSNVFMYGKTGSGKTLVANYVTQNLLKIAEKNKLPVKMIYLNCKMKQTADTEYRLIAELTNQLGMKVPFTGLPTNEVYNTFLKALDKEKILLLIILDEIDQLVEKTGDELLYNLTRINSNLKNSEVSFIGISNNTLFTENLDLRIKSSLAQEEILFPPYNAMQLLKILESRSKLAFKGNMIDEGVLPKCAAYAARESGDARKALDLLRVAGEITERKNQVKITIENLDYAEEKIERDKVQEIVEKLPKQSQVSLLAVFNLEFDKNMDNIYTGSVYEEYKKLCMNLKMRPLTQRRISDIIADLDMQGIIKTTVISQGRYGRTRKMNVAIPPSDIENINNVLKGVLNVS